MPEDTSDDEDISDQAVAVRHEAVLKAMRDKWNRLQQLKNEALYGPGGVPPEGTRGGNYRGGGGYGYFIGGRPAASRSASVTLGASGEGAADGGAGGGDEGAAVAQGLQSALTLPVGSSTSAGIGAVGSAATQFQNLSPRKRGLASAHAKRRGRPPKAAKTHHHSHSSAKHALNNSYSRSSSSNIANNSSAVVDSCGANYSESADLNDAYEQFDPHDESDDY